MVATLLEKILSSNKHTLSAILDNNGRASQCMTASNTYFSIFRDLFEKGSTVFELFDFNGADRLDRIDSRRNWPILETYPPYLEFPHDFYSKLPLCEIRILPLDDGRFMGQIWLTHYSPSTMFESSQIILYVDSLTGKLTGYNSALWSTFSHLFTKPEALLDQQVNALFNPSPLTMRNINPASPPAGTEEISGDPIFKIDDMANRDIIKHQEPSRLEPAPEGWKWSNPHSWLKFMTILKPVHMESSDLSFRIVFSIIRGDAPLLYLGVPHGNRYVEPDTYGYAFKHSFKEGRLFFKKNSFTVETADAPSEGLQPGRNEFILRALNGFFEAIINGTPSIRYRDMNPLYSFARHFALGVRPDSEITIHELEILSKPANHPPIKPLILRAEKADGGEQFFTVNRCHNPYFESYPRFRSIQGYSLQRITSLQEEIDHFKEKYEETSRENRRLGLQLLEQEEGGERMVGRSKSLLSAKEKARRLAVTALPILLTGETGTGKEVMARFIHRESALREEPFVKIDCNTLPPTLVESELFGHTKGAFTGAVRDKAGLLEQGQGGTIFIDEVSNLNLELQKKLLQFTETGRITRVGGSGDIIIKARLIFASNLDLEEMVKAGAFRQDLFYRINAGSLRLPPLRDRRDDIPALCEYYLGQFRKEYHKPAREFSPGAMKLLLEHPWPGNIRELRNVIHLAVALASGERIEKEHIQFTAGTEGEAGKRKSKGDREAGGSIRLTEDLLRHALKENRGNIRQAAATLGVDRVTVYRFAKRKGINIKDFR